MTMRASKPAASSRSSIRRTPKSLVVRRKAKGPETGSAAVGLHPGDVLPEQPRAELRLGRTPHGPGAARSGRAHPEGVRGAVEDPGLLDRGREAWCRRPPSCRGRFPVEIRNHSSQARPAEPCERTAARPSSSATAATAPDASRVRSTAHVSGSRSSIVLPAPAARRSPPAARTSAPTGQSGPPTLDTSFPCA